MSDTSLRLVPMPLADMERLAEAIAKSGLFSIKTKDQALALMAIAQAEGRHPALAARDYDVIQARLKDGSIRLSAAKKAEAMLRDFLASGGKVEWHALSDTIADATFSHPSGGTARIAWDMDRVRNAELHTRTHNMYKKYPRQMLRSRVVSEGVRTVCPAATSGMYVPEEVVDFDQHEPQASTDAAHLPSQTVASVSSPTISAEPSAAPASSVPSIAPPEPPRDPETGEILPPHAIPMQDRPLLDCLRDWVGAMRSVATHAEIAAWERHNTELLKEFEQRSPKMYARAMREMDDAAARIGAESEMLDADETADVLHS